MPMSRASSSDSLDGEPVLVTTPSEALCHSYALGHIFEKQEIYRRPIFQRSESLPEELTHGLLEDVQGPKGRRVRFQLNTVREALQPAYWVALYVALDASRSLLVSWARVQGHLCVPVVLHGKIMISMSIGMIATHLHDGSQGMWYYLNIRRVREVLPISVAFSVSQILAIRALDALDVGSMKIISQVNLPATALLSSVVLSRHYSVGQWLAMMLVLASTMVFMHVRFHSPGETDARAEDDGVDLLDKGFGMCCILVSVLLSCSGSVYAEKFLRQKFPFYIQKTILMLGEFCVVCVLVSGPWRATSFTVCSWEQATALHQIPVIGIYVVHGWAAGFLVKRCSALAKNMSHVCSTLVTYFLGLAIVPHVGAHHWPTTFAALLALLSVSVFAVVPQPKDGRSGRHPPDPMPLVRASSI